MDINLDKLDSITQIKYREFKEKVQELLNIYQQIDTNRFNLVRNKIEQMNENWDTAINLISGNFRETIDISQLLAYEYCLASERITKGKVPFESMLEKLFAGVQKFRIGNPVPGIDDECLYGKSFDDDTAIPVTSKLYRMVMNAGAQHLNYFKDGKFTGAVFIYKKSIIKAFAQDEKGNYVDMETDGIDFSDLRNEQSLLTNLRQTVFHEWTHNSEKEIIKQTKESIDYEYQSEDGKTYRNYERVNSYVTFENNDTIQEPLYIISTQRDSKGNRKKYFQDKNGNIRSLSEIYFKLKHKQLDTEYCFSSGLTTIEVMPNGENRMHNIITEGFVEQTARAMIKAIEPQVMDIDESRYPEYVEIARRVILARDLSLEKDGQGQTYADFIMHSSVLKKDLESRNVVLDNGSQVDGLHYISNYADKVQNGQTRKSQFYRNMQDVVEKLNLSTAQINEVRNSSLWAKRKLTKDEQNCLRELLVSRNPNNQSYVDSIIADFVDILEEEMKFFSEIAEKLGYIDRSAETQKNIQELVNESIESVPDLTILEEIEHVQSIQEKTIKNPKENQVI